MKKYTQDKVMPNPALNPKTLNRDAQAVISSAHAAAQEIFDRRLALDRAGKQDLPLIVIAGERHTQPAHLVHHMLVLKALMQTEPTAVAWESSHNRLEKTFEEVAGRPPDARQKARLIKADRAGDLSLKDLLAYDAGKDAPYAHKVLQSFLLRRGVPVQLVDTAFTANDLLDSADPSTAESLRACFGNAASRRQHHSPAGLWARNHHMVEKTLEFVQDIQPRILVLMCGTAHVAGNRTTRDPAYHSLAALFKEQGLPVLAMPVVTRGRRKLPANHGLAPEELFLVRGLPNIDAFYDPTENAPVPSHPAILQSRRAEATYVNGLLRRGGLEGDRLTAKFQEKLNAACAFDVNVAILGKKAMAEKLRAAIEAQRRKL
jgi:hypothetical protein